MAAALWSAAGAPAAARELWREGARSLQLSGSLRELAVATRTPDAARFFQRASAAGDACARAAQFSGCPAFDTSGERDAWRSLTRLRLDARLHLGARISAQLSYDHEFEAGVLDSLLRAPGALPQTALGLERNIFALGLRRSDAARRSWRHRIYRGSFRYAGRRLEVKLGRQRIPWGVGRLWNPVDRFNAIGPLALESDQSPGVDALLLRWNFSGFHQLQAVHAPGPRSAEARSALRYAGLLGDVDVALSAGRFSGALGLGVELAGNWGESAWRLEAAWTNPRRAAWPIGAPVPAPPASFFQIALGLDRQFDLGSGLYVMAEHLYDGNALGFGAGRAGNLLPFFETSAAPPAWAAAPAPGAQPLFAAPASAARFAGSRVVSLSRHATGLQVGYDLAAALRGELLLIHDWQGSSAVLAPALHFTGLNAASFSLGAQFFFGGAASQFGGRPVLAYALAEFFF